MKKYPITVAIIAVILTIGISACSNIPGNTAEISHPISSPTPIIIRQASPPAPIVNPADPYAWFDKPLDGFTISRQPYEIILHGSAIQGIAAMQLDITGEEPLTVTIPSTGETLVTVKHTWTPQRAGRYVLQAKTEDSQSQWSETAIVTVQVIDVNTPTPTPTATATSTSTPTVTPTLQNAFGQPTFSPDVIFQNVSCQPKNLTAAISVTDPSNVTVVMAFYRLVDQKTGDTSAWANTVMKPLGNGQYQIVFQPAPLGGDLHHFVTAHIEAQGNSFAALLMMQFAMQTNSGLIIRGQVYTAATLKNCQ
jgi:hypothetical protein